MRALILVVSAGKKKVSSTAGMQTTVRTSRLFKTRAQEVVPERMVEMERAIQERDFEAFADVTMGESNSFHATCLDTKPPIQYLNDVSWSAIQAVELINEKAGRAIAAYTFDAGPNAVIYYLEKDRDHVVGNFKAVLPQKEGWDNEQGRAVVGSWSLGDDSHLRGILENGVSRVILTSVGEGPISVQEHLIDEYGKPVEA